MVSQRLYHTLFNIDATLAMEVNDIIKKSRIVAESQGAMNNQSRVAESQGHAMVSQRLSKSRINVE